MTGLRVAMIANARFPVAEPFAGGLEAHVWALADSLRRRGHDVTLFAGAGSDAGLGLRTLDLRRPRISPAARADVSMSAPEWLDEHHAYLDLMIRLGCRDADEYDVIHNHSLHHLPVAMAGSLDVPMLCTLHTPPTPWLESAIQVAGDGGPAFAAVSAHTARAWRHLVPEAAVVHNGVDLRRWPAGPGGGSFVWSGRLVPEKGAHLAIDAADAARRPLVLAGPVADAAYVEREIRPRLARTRWATYAGHLTQRELARLVGRATAALVTPCWEEPYGLVVAEALACGTPVCGFARGALPELLDDACGLLVAPGDVDGLARALHAAGGLSRSRARWRAVAHCSLERMVEGYEDLYRELALAPVR
jgi:glycosyltransferase involved in cell wall biosynthesis